MATPDKKSRGFITGKLYFQNKEYKLAEKCISEYLVSKPDDVSALMLLAQIYENLRNYLKAFEMYERSYHLNPDRSGILLEICRILMMSEVHLEDVDYKKWLNLAIRTHPSNPIVLNLKAFLSTCPSNVQKYNTVEITPRKLCNESPVGDQLKELLSAMKQIQIRIDKIDDKIEDLSKKVNENTLQWHSYDHSDTNEATSEVFLLKMKPQQIGLFENALRKVSLHDSESSSQNTTKEQISTTNALENGVIDQVKFKESLESVSQPDIKLVNHSEIKLPTWGSNNQSTGLNFASDGNFFTNLMKQNEIKPSWSSGGTNFNFTTGVEPVFSSLSKPAFSFNNSPKTTDAETREDDDGNVSNHDIPITADPSKPLPPVIEVKTGEEDEQVMFEGRAKLFRLRDKEYKERGLGNIKVLQHNETKHGRLLMRRDLTNLVCLNSATRTVTHLEKVKENTLKWCSYDHSDTSEATPEVFLLKMKPKQIELFEEALNKVSLQDGESKSLNTTMEKISTTDVIENGLIDQVKFKESSEFVSQPDIKLVNHSEIKLPTWDSNNQSTGLNFASDGNFFTNLMKQNEIKPSWSSGGPNFNFTTGVEPVFSSLSKPAFSFNNLPKTTDAETREDDDGNVSNHDIPITADPSKPLPPVIEVKTGEEDEQVMFEGRAKLFRLRDKEYKERGLGNIKVLQHNETKHGRLLMRRDLTNLVCLNSATKTVTHLEKVKENTLKWCSYDHSDTNEATPEVFLLKMKPKQIELFEKALRRVSMHDGESSSQNTTIEQIITTNVVENGVDQLKPEESVNSDNDSDVQLVNPVIVPELVEKARLLNLPDLFYHDVIYRDQGAITGTGHDEEDD